MYRLRAHLFDEKEREEREIPCTGSLPKCLHDWKAESRSQKLNPGSLKGGRNPITWAIIATFQGLHYQGTRIRSQS